MPTPTNEPSGLYLHLWPENSPAYEVECTLCKGKGIWNSFGNTEKYPDNQKCPHCNGTGHVMKRVVGAVEVEQVKTVKQFGEQCHVYTVNANIHAFGKTWKGTRAALAEALIAAFRDGTLPEAVREHLKEVDAE